jgi:hypothetical protein
VVTEEAVEAKQIDDNKMLAEEASPLSQQIADEEKVAEE